MTTNFLPLINFRYFSAFYCCFLDSPEIVGITRPANRSPKLLAT
jgi:hypothetical protein